MKTLIILPPYRRPKLSCPLPLRRQYDDALYEGGYNELTNELISTYSLNNPTAPDGGVTLGYAFDAVTLNQTHIISSKNPLVDFPSWIGIFFHLDKVREQFYCYGHYGPWYTGKSYFFKYDARTYECTFAKEINIPRAPNAAGWGVLFNPVNNDIWVTAQATDTGSGKDGLCFRIDPVTMDPIETYTLPNNYFNGRVVMDNQGVIWGFVNTYPNTTSRSLYKFNTLTKTFTQVLSAVSNGIDIIYDSVNDRMWVCDNTAHTISLLNRGLGFLASTNTLPQVMSDAFYDDLNDVIWGFYYSGGNNYVGINVSDWSIFARMQSYDNTIGMNDIQGDLLVPSATRPNGNVLYTEDYLWNDELGKDEYILVKMDVCNLKPHKPS